MRSRQTGKNKEKVSEIIFRSRWMKVVSVLASVVVFCTVYALILPAITMSNQSTKCGIEEHTHTAECYDSEGNLTCTLEEHVHTLACYSDPYADIENTDVWDASIPELSGDRNADVVAVAASQLGYRESDANYLVSDNKETRGYTRFGHWYGDYVDGGAERLGNGLSAYAYDDWDAMFVSYVLNYAGISDLGFDRDAGNWAGALAMSGRYADPADYTPKAGDLIFFTPSADSKVQVGIVTDINKGFLGIFGDEINSLSVILGNSDNSVEEIKVSFDKYEEGNVVFEKIHGYGVLSDEEQPMDYSVTEEIIDSTLTGTGAEAEVPVDETTADMNVNNVEQPVEEVALTGLNTDNTVVEQAGTVDGTEAVQTEGSLAISETEQVENPTDVTTAEQAENPADVSTAEQAENPVDVSVAEQVVDSTDIFTKEPGVSNANEPVVEDANVNDVSTDTQEDSGLYDLAEDTEHLIGKSADDLDSEEGTEQDGAVVSLTDHYLTDDGSAIIMSWQIASQLEEGVLPTGAIIRVDMSTGKNHVMTVAQARAWGGIATIGGENTVLVDNDNYEVTFIGDNGNLYAWTDVQSMTENAVVSFTGIHVKVLNDVAVAAENNSVEFAFETTAGIADANAGMNYYVTKASVNGKTGTETFSYRNGEAVPVDQDKVLQDAGLNSNSDMKILTAEKNDYKVTMSYGAEAGIPEGSKLYVREILPGTDKHTAYIKDSKAALGIDGENDVELQGRFFDIKIITKDGEFEPEAPVNVSIEYKEAIETEDASLVSAVHFSDEGAESIPLDATDITVAQDETVKVKAVEFSAESFSVYGVVYTVDFEYTDPTTGEKYYYSLDGGDSINLTDLLVTLGIKNREEVDQFVAEEVADVVFSDPELIKVTHKGKILGVFGVEDWLLESMQAFYTTERLTINLKDDSQLIIIVTDLQYTTSLNDVLTDMTISGAEWDASTNSYVVKKGKSYTINMTFQEGEGNGQYQFSNNGQMILTLPQGVHFEADGEFNIYVNEAGENYTITGNLVSIDNNGNLVVQFNSEHEDYQKLKDLTTAKFTVSATGVFTNQSSEYIIDGQTDTKIKVDETPDVNITKSGSIIDWNSDPNTAKVKYRLEVKSNGEASGVVITDAINGTGLWYNEDATVTLGGQAVTDWVRTNNGGTGFTMTTGTLQDGQTYVIEYTATINKSDLDQNSDGSYSLGANNEVEWTGNRNTTYDLGHVVTKPGINKSGSTKEQNGSVTTTTWTIEADSDYGPGNRLKEITDRIITDGVEYVTANNGGIHVVVVDKDTNRIVKESDIPFSQILASDGKLWTYDVSQLIDNNGKKYHYTITYDTTYDIGSATEGVTISNGYEDNRDNEGEGTAWVGPNPENKFGLEKQYASKTISSGDTIVTWTIKVTIPAAGLSASDAILTDVLPSTGDYQDTFEEYVSCTGLYTNSGETVEYDAESEPGKVIFTFKTNGNKGLLASTDSKARELVLTLKTKCDPNWLNNEDAELTHTNEAIFHNEHKTAHFTPDRPSIKKEGWRDGDVEGLPKFSYSVTAGVFSDDLFTHPYAGTEVGTDDNGPYVVIKDTFDARLAYVDGSATVGGGDQYNQENGRSSSGVTASASGNIITFKLYKNTLPKNGENLYQYYKINYSLKVKNQETFEALRDTAIEQGKAVELGNTVTGFGEKNITVEYEPKVLDKSHQIKDGKLEFTIKVNEEGLKLSDNGVLVLTDEMTNLSVRYQDIKVEVAGNKTVDTTDADGNPVTAPYFNMKGHTLTFYIPDEAAVTITYLATPRGEVGADGQIHYSNTAKVKGFEKTDSGDEQYTSDASGYGTNYAVYLYKADGNVNSNALAGAEFKLYEVDSEDENGNILSGTPIKNSDGSDYVVMTSDGKDNNQKGVVMVMGTEALGWNLKPEKRYYLLETKAPDGYALDNTKYSFTISKDGYVNYTNKQVIAPDGSGKLIQAWTYHNGDVLTVKNWRKDGVLTLEKGFTGVDPSTMDDDQKAAIKFEIYTIEGEGTETTETLWRTITYDQFSAETNEDESVSYRYTIGDLPAGKYKVVEKVDDVTCTNTIYEIVDTDEGAGADNSSNDKDERYATIVISEEDVRDHTENKVNVSNTYEIPSQFKIYKHAEGETSYKLAGAEFGVFELDENNNIGEVAIATYKTNSRGRFSILQTGYVDEDGDDDKPALALDKVYALKETKEPEGFLKNKNVIYFCFLSENQNALPANAPYGTIPIVWEASAAQNIADTPDTTYLEAKKVYLNELLEENTTKHDPIQIRVKQIASYDKAGKVIETELSGYYKIGAEKPVKDVQQASVFDVIYDTTTEKWHLDNIDPVVNGQLTGLPTMTFDNHIPIYFTYEVEELPLSDYVATYEYTTNTDGGTVATVTNKPNTSNPTTKVKAKKKWIDINGEDVTSKMGLDENVTVDIYRYQGLLTRGTIYEADNSVRDAGQLYPITIADGTNGTESKVILCLPGDRIQYRIKALHFRNNKTVETAPVSVKTNDAAALGTVTKSIDTANNEIVFEFVAPTDTGDRDIRMEIQEIDSYELSSENLSAVGRKQVLTQADLVALSNVTKVGELNLNATNGWSDVSKEYVTKATVTVDHGSWTSMEQVSYTYFIVEPDGQNFEAEYQIEGDTITVVNMDKKLEVDKKWLAANGDEITEDKDWGNITYTITKNKYHIDPPAAVTLDYSGLKAAGHNIRVGSIADNIKVGATIKITVKIEDRNATPENSSLEGMTITGGNILSFTEAYRVNRNNIHQYDWMRDYFVEVTDSNLTLSGDLVTINDFGQHTKLYVSIQKEPSAVVTPPEDATPTETTEIGTVTVSYDSVVSYDFDDGYDAVSVAEGTENWSAIIDDLPAVDQEGNIFTYSVTEAVAEDFEQVQIDEEGNVTTYSGSVDAPLGGTATLANRLKPGTLKVKKIVEGADPNKTYQIAVTDTDGNYYGKDGVNYGTTPHYESFTADSTVEWNPLTPGTYTISEKDASEDGYSWTVSGTDRVTVELEQETSTTVTNSYFKNTEYIPKVTKSLKVGDEEVNPWPDGASFDFYLNFVSGTNGDTALSRTDVIMTNREAVATEENKTGQFGKIEFKKPGTYNFTIEEVEPAGTQNHKKNGIVYSQDKVTLAVVVGEKGGQPGVLEVKSVTYDLQNGEAVEGLITNHMDYPTFAPSVTKTLKENGVEVAETIWEDKSFTFDLAIDSSMTAAQIANIIMPSATDMQKTVNKDSTGHKETFGNIAFKAAGTYKFTVTEQDGGNSQITYDTAAKTIEVTVEADNDGNLSVTKVKIAGTEITGEAIVGSGVTVENTYTSEKEFMFKKVWMSDNSATAESVLWVKAITVELYGKETGKDDVKIGDYEITYPAPTRANYSSTLKSETIGGKSYYSYEITIPKLDAKYDSFYVKEKELGGYFTAYGSVVTNDQTQETSLSIGQGKAAANEGEYVINELVKVELPHTGGMGTHPFRAAGIVMIITALLGVFYMKRREKRHNA